MTLPDYSEDMNRVAKASIEHHLVHGRSLYGKPCDFLIPDALLDKSARVFTSLTTEDGETRGCMSAFADKKAGGTLFDSIRLSATRAAFSDKRFSPCGKWLLGKLSLQVFVIDDSKVKTIKTTDVDALAEFTKLGRDRSIAILHPDSGAEVAIFLPGVLSELHGSSDFVSRLASKAGMTVTLGVSAISLAALSTTSSEKRRYIDIQQLERNT